MELKDIKEHWESWSKEYKTELRATTKTSTIKMLEINALSKAIKRADYSPDQDANILEVGCGNGHNSFQLSEIYPKLNFTCVDYVPGMIENAKVIQSQEKDKYSKLDFQVGNILELSKVPNIKSNYDFVFTDRCIINLNSIDLQLQAVDQLIERLKPGGHLIILENIKQTYDKQNDCRELVGLPKRKPAEFNVFIDEDKFLKHVQSKMKLVYIDDFGSLHDIVLYVLIPLINKGEVDYKHPLVQAATDLLISMSEKHESPFGSFGQNRLYLLHKQ